MQRSKGMTKSEVLVGAVSLVIVAALFLPLMNDGTSKRRRSECEMRLRELMIGIHHYENAHGRYPGYLNAFGKDEEGLVKIGSWAIPLLPYIGEEPLYDHWADPSTTGQWNRRGGGESPTNPTFYPKIRLFMCSSDENRGDVHAPSSFAVNSGFFPDILPPSYDGLNAHQIARRSARPANGVFTNQLPAQVQCIYTKNKAELVLGSRADDPTRSKDIRDGLTMTIAITESRNADSWSQVGHDSDWKVVEIEGERYLGDELVPDRSPRVRVGVVWQYKAQPPVKGVAAYTAPASIAVDAKRTFSPEFARPSSFHRGIFNAAMLAGSVMAVKDNIDYRVLQALMTPHTEHSDVPDRDFVLKEDDYLAE